METLKRLVIYEYNENKPLPEYVRYAINSLIQLSQTCIVVLKQLPEDDDSLKDLNAETVKTRKQALNGYLNYDELILANDNFYGPFASFDPLFEEMETFDFWSIDGHSSFCVFKRKVLENPNFIENIITKPNSISHDFIEKGYKYGLKIKEPIEIDHYVKEENCPIIPRNYFLTTRHKYFNYRLKYSVDYIKTSSNYDTDLILKDLIVSGSLGNTRENLHLDFILSSRCSDNNIINTNRKIAIVMYIYPLNLVEYSYKYVQSMPKDADIYIVSTTEKVIRKCKEVFAGLNRTIQYRMQKNRGRDNSALLITCKDVIKEYDNICFVHSKQSSKLNKVIGDDFRNHCFESLLASPLYVENIIAAFEENPYLGILLPFPPNFYPYKVLGNEWMNNYENSKNFIKTRLNLDIELDKENPICAFGGMYWFRSSAFNSLMKANLAFEDFESEPLTKLDGLLTHTIERIIPTLAQNDGYYTAFVAPEYYASIYINNISSDIRVLKKELKKYDSNKHLFKTFLKKLFSDS